MTSGRFSALVANGASFTIHLPSAAAFAFTVCPAKLTEISSPGSAVPQTGTAISRCNTTLSTKIGAGTIFAKSGKETKHINHNIFRDFILSPFSEFQWTLTIQR